MSLRLSKAELAEMLSRNAGLRVAAEPLERREQAPTCGDKAPPGRISPCPGSSVQPPPLDRPAAQHPAGLDAPPPASPLPGASGLSTEQLHELMACPVWRGRLEGEEEVSFWVAAELRRLTRAGRLRCCWSRVPMEHLGGGAIGRMHQAKVVGMGAVPGCPDFGFWWGSGSGFIELKKRDAQARIAFLDSEARVRRGTRTYLKPRQKLFRDWAESHGVRHATCLTVVEVTNTLKEWGVLDG